MICIMAKKRRSYKRRAKKRHNGWLWATIAFIALLSAVAAGWFMWFV